jgi:thiol peroxidase
MATITLHGSPINTCGSLPKTASVAPQFTLTGKDLKDLSIRNFAGKKIILNIFPSLDTSVCAASMRRFNKEASGLANTVVLCVSADLPFAHSRFCTTEGIDGVVTLSCFRHPEFGFTYGVTIIDGALMGLLSRAIIVIDENGKIMYTEQVPEIAQEPDYAAALAKVK